MREKVNGNRPDKEFLKKESTSFILSASGLWVYSSDGTSLGRHIEILISSGFKGTGYYCGQQPPMIDLGPQRLPFLFIVCS